MNKQKYLHLGLIENEIIFYQDNITLAKKENANTDIIKGMNTRLNEAKKIKQDILKQLI
jgi:hypothetical protein